MKHANFGFLMRTATALGISEVIVVGKRQYDIGGACGMSKAIPKRHFHTLDLACQYVQADGLSICGIEIIEDAIPVQTQPFTGSTAFMVGNEGTGLSQQQMAWCDYFIYDPHFGADQCLNVNVATGIVLHHFSIWAGLSQSPISGNKFIPQPIQHPQMQMEKPES